MREKKRADSPKFIGKNERVSAEVREARGFENRNLWDDPSEPNEAKAQVKGAGEAGHAGQGIRQGEQEHPLEPEHIDYGESSDEVQEQQSRIIDKHGENQDGLFSHRGASKAAYSLAPVSRSVRKGTGGSANGPKGNPQARKN